MKRMAALIEKAQQTLDAMRVELSEQKPFPPPEAPWMPLAIGELGQLEDSDPGEDNPRIVEYLESTSLPLEMAEKDETPWCSAFVNWCCMKASVPGTGRANARSWMAWGFGLTEFRYGAIVVLERPPNPYHGHVGFYVGRAENGAIRLISGNSQNRVRESDYDADRVIGIRWPSGRT